MFLQKKNIFRKKIFNGQHPFLIILLLFALSACSKSNSIQSISENELFTIQYGNFEKELSISDLNNVGNIRNGIIMRDGFFYVVDGNSKKLMEFNSYGDILSLFYNEDSLTASYLEKSNRPDESVHHKIPYPFDYPGMISVDSKKNIYIACTIPKNRQEQGEGGILYSQAVLRIARDGSSVDYLGQQGPGGTPFPYIKNIYTNAKDELIVVSTSTSGMIVYWFDKSGFLRYMIPVDTNDAPSNKNENSQTETYWNVEQIIPDYNEYKLFVKIDYYSSFVDEESKVHSGVNYIETLLYELDCESGIYQNPISIPPYEENVVVDYSRLTHKIPYDFLGVTENGWKFFIIKTTEGFVIEMIEGDNQKILRRQFDMNHNNNLFFNMTLSPEGIITGLYLDKESARVVWYRTDTLIESLLKK